MQPHWLRQGRQPAPLIFDQNFIPLSRRPRDGTFFATNEDTPSLGGRANGAWYHREFDLTPMAGNYADGIYLTSAAESVNVAGDYVDNIRFTLPAPGAVIRRLVSTSRWLQGARSPRRLRRTAAHTQRVPRSTTSAGVFRGHPEELGRMRPPTSFRTGWRWRSVTSRPSTRSMSFQCRTSRRRPSSRRRQRRSA